MAEDGSRIPAWRRLGIALKNETQSGITAPEPSVSHSDEQHLAPYDARDGSHDNLHSPIEPAVNGKSPSLGKRKHQHEPAEEDGQSKRGKSSGTEMENSGTAATDFPIVEEPERVHVQTASKEVPTLDASQPKGDPNYRKKKEKTNKRRHHEDTQLEPAPAQSEAKYDRSSLSPDAAVSRKGRRTLLASTETDHETLSPAATPQQHRETSRDSKDLSGSPSAIDRRKSVTFTPDTKRVDGNSAQNLFKKWVAEQKGADADFSAAEVADFAPASVTVEEVKDAKKTEKKQKKEKKAKDPASEDSKTKLDATKTAKAHQDKPASASTPPATSKGKKKDPSIYISYLTQYHTDRDHWKFNKAKQNDVVDNALNIFRIPDEHSGALTEYVQGLKGAGVIERLRGKCKATLKELDEEDAKEPAMDDSGARQAMHDEALQTRVAKEQKRRKVEGDVEAFSEHPHSNNYIRRLRRSRAEALLTALGRASPILPAAQTNGVNPMLKHITPVRDSKKRKRRGDVSSDESSSDSSSEDESSSSDSEDSSKDSESDSSKPDSEGDDDSGSDSSSDSGSSKSGSDGSQSRDSDSD